MPFPWEGPCPELASGDPLGDGARDALAHHFPDSLPRAEQGSGELAGPVSARDTRAALTQRLLREVVSDTPEAREWARRKAETAMRRWDRGVRDGSIQHQTEV